MADTPLVITILTDADSIADAAFLDSWKTLADRCPWATCFQRPGFVVTWYGAYRTTYKPHLICGWRGDGLEGVLPLGVALADGKPVVAGISQAEYQSWLAAPSDNGVFVALALRAFDADFPEADLTFRYLPHGTPSDHLAAAG